MKIAYLCNIYPAPTHTFIRREIIGVEKESIAVERISIRASSDKLSSPEDVAELRQTFVVLDQGFVKLLASMLVLFAVRPVAMIRTSCLTARLGIRSKAGLLRHFAYLAEACVVLRFAKRKGVSHIHAHFGTNATTVAMLVSSLGGPQFSFMIHGPLEFDCPEFLHLAKKVEEATFVTAISDFAKSQAFRWSDPKHWNKIHVIRCGIDDAFISNDISAVPDVSSLVMIGRLGRSKGHLILLEALERIIAQGVSFRMKLIGDGPMRGLIEQQITGRKLGEHVELLGWMDNNLVREELLASRAMILPSFMEGLPVVLMECMAMARPVVCTRVAGVSELVVDKEHGWLINAGAVEELATALCEVLQTPVAELSRMGAAGRTVALKKHNANTEATKLSRLLTSSHNV